MSEAIDFQAGQLIDRTCDGAMELMAAQQGYLRRERRHEALFCPHVGLFTTSHCYSRNHGQGLHATLTHTTVGYKHCPSPTEAGWEMQEAAEIFTTRARSTRARTSG